MLGFHGILLILNQIVRHGDRAPWLWCGVRQWVGAIVVVGLLDFIVAVGVSFDLICYPKNFGGVARCLPLYLP